MAKVIERLSPNGQAYMRDNVMTGYDSDFGRSTVFVVCPFVQQADALGFGPVKSLSLLLLLANSCTGLHINIRAVRTGI